MKLKFLLVLVMLAALLSCSRGRGGNQDLNVLLITVDTLRYDRVGFLDPRHARTPHMDGLARRSLVFTRAFAHNPVTLPSHANILTGATPLHHGISDNTGFRLDGRFMTIPQYLRRREYRTAAFIGAFPLDSRFGLDQGFDLYDDDLGARSENDFLFVERPAEKVIAPAMSWIREQRGKWFAWVHLFDPHHPYQPPSPFREKYASDPYSGEVAYLDSQLGILFDFLRAQGQMEKTLIILTSDHGEALGEKGEDTHSYFAYNNTIHVPLFIHVPGRAPETFAVNVCHADIFPTLCDILGMPPPDSLQGESLLAVMAAGKRKQPEIYFESLTPWLNRDWAPLRGMISGDTKFIDLPIREVYDLAGDMKEERNLAAASPVGRLQSELEKLIKRLRDPQASIRRSRLDPDEQRRLESLGYISESRSGPRKKRYTEQDDLKTLLPLQTRMLVAVREYQQGDFPAAAAIMREVINSSPGFVQAYDHLGYMYHQQKQNREAVTVLEQGLDKNPGNLQLLTRLGAILALDGDWRRAIPILERCVALEDFDPDKFHYLGIAYYQGGEIDKALDSYARALEADPKNATLLSHAGGARLARFARNGSDADLKLAEKHFLEALKIDPALLSAGNGLGIVYSRGNRLEEALAAWRRTLVVKPDFAPVLLNLGITLLEAGRAGEALEHLQKYRAASYSKLPAAERQRIDGLIAEARAQAN
jgi:arylsulfatase A-like enzyme/tetratricopeptide (TPR) repeat protein